MSTSYQRTANLLGALSLALCERVGDASEPAALVTLLHHPGGSVDDLARALGLTHSGAVRLVDRLAASGLVRRTSGERGRTLALRLTAAGEGKARDVLARRQQALEPLLAELDPSECTALSALCDRLLRALTTDRSSARHICRLCDEAATG